MPSGSKTQPLDRVRAQRCLDMKLQGSTWISIAETEGYADESGARRAVERLLDRVDAVHVTSYREVESGRLDALQARYWPDALSGDIKAAEFVLKVSGQRAKLLGLNVPDKVVIAEADAMSPEAFATEAVRMMRALGITPPEQMASEAGLAGHAALPSPHTAIAAHSTTDTTDPDMNEWTNLS